MDSSQALYEPYHPHLGYTLAVTCLGWLLIAWYSRYQLREAPRARAILYSVAIFLPIHAELTSYLIYLLRPGPETALGAWLLGFHNRVLVSLPLDTFLEPVVILVAIVAVIVLLLISIVRFIVGNRQIRRLISFATPLTSTHYRPFAQQLKTLADQHQQTMPAVFVLPLDLPLAFTSGMVQGKIYLADSLFLRLQPDEVMAVICHEWAHILRRDNLRNSLVRLGRDMLVFMPGGYLLWEALVRSEDEACDLLAVKLTGEPLALARALVKVAMAWQGKQQYQQALVGTSSFAMAETGPERRVAQMIRVSDASSESIHHSVIGTTVMTCGLLLLAILPTLVGC